MKNYNDHNESPRHEERPSIFMMVLGGVIILSIISGIIRMLPPAILVILALIFVAKVFYNLGLKNEPKPSAARPVMTYSSAPTVTTYQTQVADEETASLRASRQEDINTCLANHDGWLWEWPAGRTTEYIYLYEANNSNVVFRGDLVIDPVTFRVERVIPHKDGVEPFENAALITSQKLMAIKHNEPLDAFFATRKDGRREHASWVDYNSGLLLVTIPSLKVTSAKAQAVFAKDDITVEAITVSMPDGSKRTLKRGKQAVKRENASEEVPTAAPVTKPKGPKEVQQPVPATSEETPTHAAPPDPHGSSGLPAEELKRNAYQVAAAMQQDLTNKAYSVYNDTQAEYLVMEWPEGMYFTDEVQALVDYLTGKESAFDKGAIDADAKTFSLHLRKEAQEEMDAEADVEEGEEVEVNE